VKLDKSDKMPTLNDINYLKFTPKGPLGDYVQAIWFTHNLSNRGEQTFKLLSDCGSCIIMNFSDELLLERNGKTHKVAHEAVVVGPSKNLFEITFIDQVLTLGINFHPGAGSVFMEGEIETLIDSIAQCNRDEFSDIDSLYENVRKCLNCDGVERIFEQTETLLENYLAKYCQLSPFKFKTLLLALNHKKELPLEGISVIDRLSKREVQRKFKQYIGISPNVYQRIIKLNKIKAQLSNGAFENLTQLALDNGYFDQAHFIRDFKYFMKLTPKEYCKSKGN
jgi:AraC-like DNA-binding protein